MSRSSSKSAVRYAAAVLWTLAILVACTLPGSSLPSTSLWEYDKVGHFVLFAVFGWLWMRALPASSRVVTLSVLAGGIFYAVGTEIYQGLLPFDRHPDPYDALANIAGLFAGMIAYSWKASARVRQSR
jgi:VanZ family protein